MTEWKFRQGAKLHDTVSEFEGVVIARSEQGAVRFYLLQPKAEGCLLPDAEQFEESRLIEAEPKRRAGIKVEKDASA